MPDINKAMNDWVMNNQHNIRNMMGVGGGGGIAVDDEGDYWTFKRGNNELFKVQKSDSAFVVTTDLVFGDAVTDTLTISGALTSGADGAGVGDVIFYGADTGKKVTWDVSENMLDVDGIMKIHNRPVSTDTYALEVKADYDQASGVGQGAFQCSTRVYPATDTTTVLARGGYFQCQLHADDAMTDGGMTALYTQVHNNGTGVLNGAAIKVESLRTDIADGGTWTAVERLCSLHVDSNLSQVITAGDFHLLYISNSGTTAATSAIKIDNTGTYVTGIDIAGTSLPHTLTTGISIGEATTGISLSGDTMTAIDITGDNAIGINITGVTSSGIYLNPTTTADASMTPINILYNYDGSTNTGVDIDMFTIRTKITQTGTNAEAETLRGYLQGIRSDIDTAGFTSLVYGMYSKVTCTAATTSPEIYGVTSAVYLGSYEATVTHVAALFGKVNGTGNIVGSGAADVVGASGLYISWSSENACATALTAGAHIAIEASSLCDSGYQVDVGGTLTNGLYVRNTGGTLTNAIKVGGALSFFADFDDATGCVDATATGLSGTCAGRVLVKMQDGGTAYINCWTN